MTSTDYDVVVVGARCAGAATAMLLARRGLRVALVDRAAYGTDTLSTHALMRAGVVQLNRWGLLDSIIDAGTPAVRRTLFHYGDDRSATVTIKPSHGVDALYAPRRMVLDPVLVDAAWAAGVDVVFGVAVTDVARDADGRVVGIVGRDEHGAAVEIRAQFTVGADGMRSTVAKRVGATVEHRARRASAFIYSYAPALDADGYEWFYWPGVTAGLMPTNDGQTCLWVGAPSTRFRGTPAREVRDAFDSLLAETSAELAARVARAGQPERLRIFPGEPGFMRVPWGAGWALVGDAGYYKDPISSHGISDALRDAELVSRAIASVVTDGVPEALAMREYHDVRNQLSHQLFAVTERIASYAWDTGSVESHLRALSASMAAEVDYLAALDDEDASSLTG